MSLIFNEDGLVALRNKASFRVITESPWFSDVGSDWELKVLRLTFSFCRFSNIAKRNSPTPSSYSHIISVTVKFSSYLIPQNTLSASIPLPPVIGDNLFSPGAMVYPRPVGRSSALNSRSRIQQTNPILM